MWYKEHSARLEEHVEFVGTMRPVTVTIVLLCDVKSVIISINAQLNYRTLQQAHDQMRERDLAGSFQREDIVVLY